MGDNLVPNGLSMVCKVLCSKSIYPRSWWSSSSKGSSLAGRYFPYGKIFNEPHKLVYDDIVKFLTCLGAGQ